MELPMGQYSAVLWRRVWGIALVQGSVTLMWITYRLYLGDLLKGWGFSPEFVVGLLTFEMVLGVVMEPLFGGPERSPTAKFRHSIPINFLGGDSRRRFFPFNSLSIFPAHCQRSSVLTPQPGDRLSHSYDLIS
ncbi:hypothetical protein NON20_03005 [Synechocystis sp. B12]|nr:hypothetical protein NON20_03005 [Synechocystis sp. B12]